MLLILLYILVYNLSPFLVIAQRPRQLFQPSIFFKMASSEGPSHFTVHVFLNHDPMIARALLPDLFADFPESAWKLPPLVEFPRRPLEGPDAVAAMSANPRDVLGRYVLSEPVARGTTFLQLSGRVEREFALLRKHQGQFTIFPQHYSEDCGYAPWHDRPLPWDATLADVCAFDLDALETGAEMYETHAFVLQLVLETKAAALARVVGVLFLDEEIGEPHRLFRQLFNRYDSFWHCHGRQLQGSQLEVTLVDWRRARAAHAYLARQRDTGRLGPQNDELSRKTRRVEEIRELKGRVGLSPLDSMNLGIELNSNLLPRVMQIEANEANGREQLRDLSVFVTQWEDWIAHGEFQNFDIRILAEDEAEARVASLFRHKKQVIDKWRSSEGRKQLHASIEDEYYAARPWLTKEDRERAERARLQGLKHAEPRPSVDTHTEPAPSLPSAEIQAHSMRSADGKLIADRSVFTVSSGSLLWGQILCLYYAMSHPGFTENADHAPPELEGGTIVRHRFTYRSAARNGRWKVRRYSMRARSDPDAPGRHVGWILYHEDVDPMDTLARVRALDGTGPGAVSNRNRHTDKDVLYVGRYDWSTHFGKNLEPEFQRWAEPVIGPVPDTGDPYDTPRCNVRKDGYLLAIDEAESGLDFVAAYKRDCDRASHDEDDVRRAQTIETAFRKDGANFGAYVSMPHTEYELGWLVFSGERHADHDADELVAIVYDGSYEALESVYHSIEGE